MIGRMKNKKGLEFSFEWMFAIIAGAVIIFLAIYGTTRLIGTEREISQTEAGSALSALLNPVETSVESAKISEIVFPVRARLYNGCDASGNFGSQSISVAEQSGFAQAWTAPGVPAVIYNKYIFSDNVIEGDNFMVFSKPFSMPFEIGNLIFMWPKDKEYCFVQPPTEIRDEINALNPTDINITNDVRECRQGNVIVCFAASGCDVDVTFGASELSGTVRKGYDSVYYEGPLVYGAIFAPKDLYECQVKRLMKRASELASLYAAKSAYASANSCSGNLGAELLFFANSTQIADSSGLRNVGNLADELGRANENLACKLF